MKAMRVIPGLLLPLLMTLVSAGLPDGVAAEERVEDELHKTYPFEPAGRLHIANVNGKVEISTWDREEVQLDALKRGGSQSDRDEVKIEIEASRERIRVDTRYPSRKWSWRGNNTRVDYTLKVPVGTRLDKVSSVNGSVAIDGVRGPVEASTVNGRLTARGLAAATEVSAVNGSVEISFAELKGVKRISASSVNGRVTIALPSEANAELDVNSVNGGISTGFDVTVKKNWPIGRELKATLGEGGTKVKASTVNGSVRIERTDPT